MSLEKFIQEQKESFEMMKPPAFDFDRYEKYKQSSEKPQAIVRKINWWSYAAVAALLILALGIGFYMGYESVPNTTQIVEKPIEKKEFDIMLADISEQLGEKEKTYRAQIDTTYNSFNDNDFELLGIDEGTREELKLRDETYNYLYLSLQDNPNNERVSDAILEYYDSKLELLNSLQDRLTAVKTEARP